MSTDSSGRQCLTRSMDTRRQLHLGSLKEMIRKIDPEAFVVVTDTMEVMGKRIGNQPHW